MDQDRTGRREGAGGRARPSRRSIELWAALAMPVVVLVFAGSLLVIPLIYIIVILDGIGIAYAVARSGGPFGGGTITSDEGGGPVGSPGRRRPDRAESLASYIKRAKGSEFSRREIARSVARIMGQSSALSPGSATADRDLSDAVRTVVYPYRDDPVVKAGMGPLEERFFGGENASALPERSPSQSRYVASLEVIVSRLDRARTSQGAWQTIERRG